MRPPHILASVSLITLVAAGTAVTPARADWPHQPYGNVAVCATSGDQTIPRAVSDGAGGIIVVWKDHRGTDDDIYAQRVSATGVPLWTGNGVSICNFAGVQDWPAIAPDGAGGAVIAWSDQRLGGYNIFAQRVNASGVALWGPNGVALTSIVGNKYRPQIVSDGAGGAIVAWEDLRSVNPGIYARRVNAGGTPAWTTDGNAVATAGGSPGPQHISMDSDGTGGAVLTWEDSRSGPSDIYAQRINGSGAMLWTSGGFAVCTSGFLQEFPVIASDGTGGALIAWQDDRSGVAGEIDIYAAKIGPQGGNQWGFQGSVVCTISGRQLEPTLVSDGAGGAIIAWRDERTGGASTDIFIQRLDDASNPQWGSNGILLCGATGNQVAPNVLADGSGGAIVAWQDARNPGVNDDIYAQHVDAFGSVLWTPGGVALCNEGASQIAPRLVSDGADGAIAAWDDYRSAPNHDIYAQRVAAFGALGNPEPKITDAADVPNDQGGKIKLSWNASYLDLAPYYQIDTYWVMRSVPSAMVARAARLGARVTRDPRDGPRSGERVFLVNAAAGPNYAWEFLVSRPAFHVPSYSEVAATTGDSIAGSNPPTAFMVMAWANNGTEWWYSNPDSAYSVDNLSPAVPAPFTGTYSSGSTALHWGPNAEADFALYRLYRGNSPGFVPGPSNLVAARPDTGFVDAGSAGSYYKLSAVDIHGNESPFALLTPDGTTDVSGAPAALSLWLAPVAPNPVRGRVSLRFALPRQTGVTLALYDAGGRRVRDLARGSLPAGEHAVEWDGLDAAGEPAASGLYFVRLDAQGRRLTARFALLR